MDPRLSAEIGALERIKIFEEFGNPYFFEPTEFISVSKTDCSLDFEVDFYGQALDMIRESGATVPEFDVDRWEAEKFHLVVSADGGALRTAWEIGIRACRVLRNGGTVGFPCGSTVSRALYLAALPLPPGVPIYHLHITPGTGCRHHGNGVEAAVNHRAEV
ncbi:MAG: hypothetical protein PHU46_12025 [Rhodocyclaceae bacterium]|nr:hypothetical protein [Rhodocyclaceae bacterium]